MSKTDIGEGFCQTYNIRRSFSHCLGDDVENLIFYFLKLFLNKDLSWQNPMAGISSYTYHMQKYEDMHQLLMWPVFFWDFLFPFFYHNQGIWLHFFDWEVPFKLKWRNERMKSLYHCLKRTYRKAGEGLFKKAWMDRTRVNGFEIKGCRFRWDIIKKTL